MSEWIKTADKKTRTRTARKPCTGLLDTRSIKAKMERKG